jgi:hypothetical protein
MLILKKVRCGDSEGVSSYQEKLFHGRKLMPKWHLCSIPK